MNPTLYDILGVSSDASREEIRKAWREAADRFEPGEGGSTKQFRLFNEAAEVLLDPEQRKKYDAQLAGAAGTAPEEQAEAQSAVSLRKDEAEQDDAPADHATEDDTPGAEPVEDEAPADEAAEEEPTPAATTLAATAPAAPVPGAAAATAEAGSGSSGESTGNAGTPGGRRLLSTPVLIGIAAVTALVVGVAAYFVVQAQRAEAYQEALDRAPAAAENAATAVLSYDYESLEADRDAASKFLTDEYREKYVDTFDKLVSENATDTKATVKAQVLASSAMPVGEDRDSGRIQVLLFVNQTTTNAATTGQPSVALNRVRFDMVEQDGTWLVDDITSY